MHRDQVLPKKERKKDDHDANDLNNIFIHPRRKKEQDNYEFYFRQKEEDMNGIIII